MGAAIPVVAAVVGIGLSLWAGGRRSVPAHAPGEEERRRAQEECDRLARQHAEVSERICAQQTDHQRALGEMVQEETRQQRDHAQAQAEQQAEMEQAQQQRKQEANRLREEQARIEQAMQEQKRSAAEQQRQIAERWPRPEWLTDTAGRLNFGFTGASGVGKSSLINRILELQPNDARAARTDVMECTMTPTAYSASTSQLGEVTLWDLPGAGTGRFPRDSYIQRMGLRYFDGLVILGAGRFTEIDMLLFKEALVWQIPCYLVRNKADCDCESNEEDRGIAPMQTVGLLVEDLQAKMREIGIVEESLGRCFVISARARKYPDVLQPQYEAFFRMVVADVARQRQAPAGGDSRRWRQA